MICSIMQPTYLPWIGYFDLYDQADVFVLLDTVQFSRQSWQQRNRVKTRQGLQWLSVPVIKKFPQSIREAIISDPFAVAKHLDTIAHNYSKAGAFNDYFDDFAKVFNESIEHSRLVDLNCGLIDYFKYALGIDTRTVISSELGIEGKRTAMLADICEYFGATTYLSPQGAANYLIEDAEVFFNRGIDVRFHQFNHPVYEQLYPPFVPQASVLDLVLNEGKESMSVIRRGRCSCIDIHQMKKNICSD